MFEAVLRWVNHSPEIRGASLANLIEVHVQLKMMSNECFQ